MPQLLPVHALDFEAQSLVQSSRAFIVLEMPNAHSMHSGGLESPFKDPVDRLAAVTLALICFYYSESQHRYTSETSSPTYANPNLRKSMLHHRRWHRLQSNRANGDGLPIRLRGWQADYDPEERFFEILNVLECTLPALRFGDHSVGVDPCYGVLLHREEEGFVLGGFCGTVDEAGGAERAGHG